MTNATNLRGNLSEVDYANMTAFVGHVLDDVAAGTITRDQAIGGLTHVMAALDQGNHGEAVVWLRQGRKLIRDAS